MGVPLVDIGIYLIFFKEIIWVNGMSQLWTLKLAFCRVVWTDVSHLDTLPPVWFLSGEVIVKTKLLEQDCTRAHTELLQSGRETSGPTTTLGLKRRVIRPSQWIVRKRCLDSSVGVFCRKSLLRCLSSSSSKKRERESRERKAHLSFYLPFTIMCWGHGLPCFSCRYSFILLLFYCTIYKNALRAMVRH